MEVPVDYEYLAQFALVTKLRFDYRNNSFLMSQPSSSQTTESSSPQSFHTYAITCKTAKDVTRDRLPDLILSKNCTYSESKKNTIFKGQRWRWVKFEDEVRECCQAQNWPEAVLSASVQRGKKDVSFETLHCGDESSISGRFFQNALHIVTEVCQELGYKVRFGDSRIVKAVERKEAVRRAEKAVGMKSQLKELNPDIVACDENYNTRFVGELKTSWTVALDGLVEPNQRDRFTAVLGRLLSPFLVW
jgi:hypothetical protein